eukprot:5718761-Prymnesium_polylepis.1
MIINRGSGVGSYCVMGVADHIGYMNNPSTTTHDGATIATQCCASDDDTSSGCRRVINGVCHAGTAGLGNLLVNT